MSHQPPSRHERFSLDGNRLHQAACASYVTGLLLIFAFSLYLLPDDAGIGRLLFGAGAAAS